MKNMQSKFNIADEQSMLDFGKQLASICTQGNIFLRGELGAGKTTLVRGFLRGLGFKGVVKSPTYTLVESYQIGGKKIFHFDLYRLKNNRELKNIGIEEYFANDAVCLVEWAERGFPLLPTPDLDCEFKILASGREVICQAFTENGKNFLQKLKKDFSHRF